jgi:hypothetical protein
MSALPLLGAALTLRSVEQHRDWLFEQNRDLELQEFHQASVLDGDWRSVVDACKRALDGFHGRLSTTSIHVRCRLSHTLQRASRIGKQPAGISMFTP